MALSVLLSSTSNSQTGYRNKKFSGGIPDGNHVVKNNRLEYAGLLTNAAVITANYTNTRAIAFGQTTAISEKYRIPSNVLFAQHFSFENRAAWVDTTLEYCYYDWDTLTISWLNNLRMTVSYDANGNQIERISQNWDGSSWVNSSRYTYTYDANGNNIEYIYQIWDGSSWVNNLRHTYTYDVSGNQIEYIWQNWDGSSWENYVRYAVCNYVAAITERQPTSLSLYPNPNDGHFILKLQSDISGKVEVTNNIGQLIFNVAINGTTTTIDLGEDCSAGLYFVALYNEHGELVNQQKLIVQ